MTLPELGMQPAPPFPFRRSDHTAFDTPDLLFTIELPTSRARSSKLSLQIS